MTMRTRRRPTTPERKDRMFVTTEVALTLVAANQSVASQQLTNQLNSDAESRAGRSSRGMTVARIWVRGFYFTLAVVTTPVVIGVQLGVGIYPSGIDVGDFPNVAAHAGDWMLHDTRRLHDSASLTVAPTLLEPQEVATGGAVLDLDNKSMRKIRKANDELFVVLQKDGVTEENIQFHADFTVMWLLD